jgi:hypothetical protein
MTWRIFLSLCPLKNYNQATAGMVAWRFDRATEYSNGKQDDG